MPDIDINGTTLHYLDDGPRDAPAVVFSPSLFWDGEMFAAQTAALSDRFRVIRYDLRGQGRSARMPREQLDFDTQTEDAAALILKLDLAPCTYVGQSMGGFIAMRLAARRPDLLSSAVVIGSSAAAEEHVAEMDRLIDLLREQGMAAIIDPLMEFSVGDTTLTDPSRAEVLDRVRTHFLSRGPADADAAWHVPHRDAVLDELGDIRVPVLVIAGAEDRTYPVEQSGQIADTIPEAKLIIVERAGHLVALERPDAVTAALEEHLAQTVSVTA